MIFLDNFIELLNKILISRKSGLYLAGDRDTISTEYLISEIRRNLGRSASLFKLPSFLVSILAILKPELIKRLFGSLEMDTNESNKRLEFTPPHTSEYGIKQMVDWYISKKENR
jgi:nucleoside-diphosphate-sugar epimerase